MARLRPDRNYPMISNCGPFRRKQVGSYLARLNRPSNAKIYDSTVTAIVKAAGIEVEEDPASRFDPSQLWDALYSYDSEDKPREYSEAMKSAVNKAYRAFGWNGAFAKLTPLPLDDSLKDAIKLDKSAGIYMSSKLDSWMLGMERARAVLEGSKAPNPCLVGYRTQRSSKPNGKTRLVWMYPLDMTLLEACFARPLIEKFKLGITPMPYAMRRVDLGTKLHYTITERNVVCLDFSRFDASVPSWMINVAFDILGTWFDMDQRSERMWRIVRRYFIQTPIVMPDGNLYRGKSKGVPSGSYFTQMVDSIVNYIVINYIGNNLDLKLHEKRVFVLGDDSVFSTNMDVNLQTVAGLAKRLGFSLNVEKSTVSRDYLHFLGFEWVDGFAYKDESAIVKSMTQPERWRKREKSRRDEYVRACRIIFEMVHLTADPSLAMKLYCEKPRPLLYIFGSLPTNEPGKLPGYLGFIQEEFEHRSNGRFGTDALFN